MINFVLDNSSVKIIKSFLMFLSFYIVKRYLNPIVPLNLSFNTR